MQLRESKRPKDKQKPMSKKESLSIFEIISLLRNSRRLIPKQFVDSKSTKNSYVLKDSKGTFFL